MIENTTDHDPTIHLLGFMSEGNDAYIEGMEAAGQRQLVTSDRLPTKTQDGDHPYLDAGFTFDPADSNDPMFRQATLPSGWTREGSDHAMWSYIVDEHGRRRVSIFYKAAFYDRSSFMRMYTPSSYLDEVLYADTEPVLDDAWLTPEVAVAELEGIRDRHLTAVEEDRERLARTGDTYWVGRVAESQALADKAEAIRLRIAAAAR